MIGLKWKRAAWALSLLMALVPAQQRVLAAPPTEPEPRATPVLSAAEQYRYATGHLKRGRWFELSVRRLAEAIRQEPENPAYHLALGCALASRAASLSHAAVFARGLDAYRERYSQRLAEWEAAQKDVESDEYGEPPPTPPPAVVFRTKDDDRRFTLTNAQARARIAALGEAARAAWEKAAVLAGTPAARAEVQYVRGWGLRLLARSVVPSEDTPPPPTAASRETIKAMETAVALDPGNPIYWQALGDVLGGDGGWLQTLDFFGHFNSDGEDEDEEEDGEGSGGGEAATNPASPSRDAARIRRAYDRSLELNGRNAALWYHVFRRSPQQRQERIAPALHALRRAAQAEEGRNAYPWYELAAFDFRKTRYGMVLGSPPSERDRALAEIAAAADPESPRIARQAIAYMERGNRALRYAVPRYRPAVPSLLAAAWDYAGRIEADANAELPGGAYRELARAACGYALATAQENKGAEAARVCRTVIGAGHKMRGRWPESGEDGDGDAFVGVAVAGIGYQTLEQVYRWTGDRARADQAQAEYAFFQRNVKAAADALLERLLARSEIDYLLTAY